MNITHTTPTQSHTFKQSSELENWRRMMSLPRFEAADQAKPKPVRAFDLDACLRTYRESIPTDIYTWQGFGYWSEYLWAQKFPFEGMSEPEARFWFMAMSEVSRWPETKKQHSSDATLAAMDFDRDQTIEELIDRLDTQEAALHKLLPQNNNVRFYNFFSHLVLYMKILFPREEHLEIVAKLLDGVKQLPDDQINGLIPLVPLPRDEAELERGQALARKIYGKLDASSIHHYHLLQNLAIAYGLSEHYTELFDAAIASDQTKHFVAPNIQALYYTLPEERRAEAFKAMKRGLQGSNAQHEFAVNGWENIAQWFEVGASKDGAGGWIEVAQHLQSPLLAKFWVQLAASGARRIHGEHWLYSQGANAIAGCIPLLASRGSIKEMALKVLRRYKSEGHEQLIRDVAAGLSDDTGKSALEKLVLDWAPRSKPLLDDSTTPQWLKDLTRSHKSLPLLLKDEELPTLFTADGEHQLTETQVVALACLLESSGGSPMISDAVLKARRDIERRGLGELSWLVFDTWHKHGSNTKQPWAYLAIGRFGTPKEGQKVAPHLKIWPKQNKWRMAQDALHIYEMMGEDGALMTLHGIAQKVKQKSVRGEAERLLAKIAKDHQLTPEQLEDRIIPDCDLDELGRYTFDYGDRQFTLMFDAELSPILRDEERGKIIKSLPKPGKSDDEEKAEEAREAFKEMKKQIKEVISIQKPRLERAMITGRVWSARNFMELIVGHPLMVNFARRLLWGVVDDKHAITACFRVDEESELLDAEDEPFRLAPSAKVCIVHPLELDKEQEETWGTVFGDYEITPPFPQLGRPVYGLEEEEKGKKTITRFKDLKIPALSVRGFIEHGFWQRGQAEDAGIVNVFYCEFPTKHVSCTVTMESGFSISGGDWDPQGGFPSVAFYQGKGVKYQTWRDDGAMVLDEVPEVVLSEVLYSLSQFTSKYPNK